jgi:hypothetical protein
MRAPGGARLFPSVAPIQCLQLTTSLYGRDCPVAGRADGSEVNKLIRAKLPA